MNQRQIPLIGGPLDGTVHELYGSLMPDRIGLPHPDEENPTELHWYALRDGKGYFEHTKKKED